MSGTRMALGQSQPMLVFRAADIYLNAGALAAPAAASSQIFATDARGQATLTFVGLPTGTDIVVLAAGTSNVLLQVDANPGTSYAYDHALYAADTVVDVGFICPGYELQYVRNLTLPRSTAVLPIALRADRNFV